MAKPMTGREYLAKQIDANRDAYSECLLQLERAKTKERRAKIRKEMKRLELARLILDATAFGRNKS